MKDKNGSNDDSPLFKEAEKLKTTVGKIMKNSIEPQLKILNNMKSIAIPPIINVPKIANHNLASAFHDRLIEMINEFDSKLDQENEVGIKLVSFGQTVKIHVHDLGYFNPSLICFYGYLDDGSPIELIQHVSQISFLLIALKRLDPEIPKKPIGFIHTEE